MSTSAATASGVMVSALRRPCVAAGGQVALQRVGVVVAQARRDDLGGVGDGHQAFFSPGVGGRGRGGLRLGHGGPLGHDGGAVGLQADAAAHPDQRAVAGHRVGQAAGAQVVDQRVEALGRLRAHVAVVDLHARRAVAVGQALGLVAG